MKNKQARLVLILLAVGLAIVGIVMPVAFGIDPLGARRLFSTSYPLLKMDDAGSGPDVPRPEEANNPPPTEQYSVREDTIVVTVPAGKGIEYKIYMLKHGSLKYAWNSGQDVLFVDFHGEVNQLNPPKDVFYESYTVAFSNNMVGTFLSPFEGKHGWYFKNRGKDDVVVTVNLKGQYTIPG